MSSTARPLALRLAFALLLCLGAVAALAQEFDEVVIEPTDLGHGVYMLDGAGGNMGVIVGEDGVFLIDDQFAPLTPKIQAAIATLTDRPVSYVLNTHFHGDHTGGNENFGKSGSVIVAHNNVRKRMSMDQALEALGRQIPASPADALPVITFTDEVAFHLNDEEIRVIHVPRAHTDGDALVHFPGANVIHMGDTFFNGLYPFVDYSGGGSLEGIISAVDIALELANDVTKIIPGHGPLADRAALLAYRNDMHEINSRIAALVAEGKSNDEIVAATPTAEWDETLGKVWLTPEQFVGFVANGIRGR